MSAFLLRFICRLLYLQTKSPTFIRKRNMFPQFLLIFFAHGGDPTDRIQVGAKVDHVLLGLSDICGFADPKSRS